MPLLYGANGNGVVARDAESSYPVVARTYGYHTPPNLRGGNLLLQENAIGNLVDSAVATDGYQVAIAIEASAEDEYVLSDKVTRKYQYINGQVAQVALVGSVEVKPSVSKILVKGDKYVPNVADLSYWAWPTERPYVITTGYGYRWGSMHAAIDISGPGHGSNLYASNICPS